MAPGVLKQSDFHSVAFYGWEERFILGSPLVKERGCWDLSMKSGA